MCIVKIKLLREHEKVQSKKVVCKFCYIDLRVAYTRRKVNTQRWGFLGIRLISSQTQQTRAFKSKRKMKTASYKLRLTMGPISSFTDKLVVRYV